MGAVPPGRLPEGAHRAGRGGSGGGGPRRWRAARRARALQDRSESASRRPVHDFAPRDGAQHRLREAVDAHVPGQEALQHAAHEKGAAAFEEQLVEFEGDLEAAPEAQRAGHRQAADHCLAAHRTQALDLPGHAHLGGGGVEAEQLAQRGGAFALVGVEERQVVERELADELPGLGALGHRRPGPRRAPNAADRLDGGGGLHHEIAAPEAGRHDDRQVAVGAPGQHRELAQIAAVRRFAGVDEGQEDFAADIAGARAGALLAFGMQPRFAAQGVEAVGRRVGGVVVGFDLVGVVLGDDGAADHDLAVQPRLVQGLDHLVGRPRARRLLGAATARHAGEGRARDQQMGGDRTFIGFHVADHHLDQKIPKFYNQVHDQLLKHLKYFCYFHLC